VTEPNETGRPPAAGRTGRHTIIVRLHDRPGALYRAVGLVRRRGYNVSSLVVGASERPGTSLMVLVVEAADVRQVLLQLSRLVDVLDVEEVPADPTQVDRFVETMLRFEVRTLPSTAPRAQEIA
jgi:acetolactate synthase-1/3 small subunit